MPTAPKTTPTERKALAAEKAKAVRIAKLRASGVSWDGDGGIREQGLVKTAPQGRALLRKHGLVDAAGGIARSYVRDDGFRAAESERRQAKVNAAAKPVPKERKSAAKPKATRRARKVA